MGQLIDHGWKPLLWPAPQSGANHQSEGLGGSNSPTLGAPASRRLGPTRDPHVGKPCRRDAGAPRNLTRTTAAEPGSVAINEGIKMTCLS
jgi:hypothetical protein